MKKTSRRKLSTQSNRSRTTFNQAKSKTTQNIPNAGLMSRSLLDIESLSTNEIENILKLTHKLNERSQKSLNSELPYKQIALLFYETSTRTRISFEFATKA